MNKVRKVKLVALIISLFITSLTISQKVNKQDSITIRTIYDTALLNGKSYEWLDYLSNEIPIAVSYNGIAHVVMMASPTDLEEFVVGFSLMTFCACK